MNDRTHDAPDGGDDERLIDYLYDELSPSERERFEAELAASPALMAELTAMRETRSEFVALPVEPMPRGLLDEVLLQADQQAAELSRLRYADEARNQAAPTLWQRLAEGLKRLAFQPAFTMGMVFVLVAGVALVATRNPSEIPGMELPRDVQRIPPMAMAPAPAAQAAAEPVLAEVAVAEPVPAEVALAAPMADEEAFAGDLKPIEPVQAGALADRAERPRAERWTKGELERAPSKADRARSLRDQPGELQAVAKAAVSKETADVVKKAEDGNAPAEPAPVAFAARTGMSSEGTSGAGLRPDVSGTRGSPRSDAVTEEKVAQSQEVDQAKSKSSDGKVPERSLSNQPVREASKLADDVGEVPASPPKPAAKPAEPSSDRIYTTLSQQLAAGALTDAEKSLTELAKLEGESARVKKARDVIAQAKAKAVKPPAETKPMPEPAKAPNP